MNGNADHDGVTRNKSQGKSRRLCGGFADELLIRMVAVYLNRGPYTLAARRLLQIQEWLAVS